MVFAIKSAYSDATIMHDTENSDEKEKNEDVLGGGGWTDYGGSCDKAISLNSSSATLFSPLLLPFFYVPSLCQLLGLPEKSHLIKKKIPKRKKKKKQVSLNQYI